MDGRVYGQFAEKIFRQSKFLAENKPSSMSGKLSVDELGLIPALSVEFEGGIATFDEDETMDASVPFFTSSDTLLSATVSASESLSLRL